MMRPRTKQYIGIPYHTIVCRRRSSILLARFSSRVLPPRSWPGAHGTAQHRTATAGRAGRKQQQHRLFKCHQTKRKCASMACDCNACSARSLALCCLCVCPSSGARRLICPSFSPSSATWTWLCEAGTLDMLLVR